MLTDYFGTPSAIVTEYYELRRSFIDRNMFKIVYNEVGTYLIQNASRQSGVCVSDDYIDTFTIYDFPRLPWTKTIANIRASIIRDGGSDPNLDYGLIQYYHDDKASINWHFDKEAMQSPVYAVNIGGTRRFCLRNKLTHVVTTFDLHDGDLFIMKAGCQSKFEHCIKSIKSFNKPRISITFRALETTATAKKPKDLKYQKVINGSS